MPYSAQFRCAFVHIPKTGGSSVLRALLDAGVPFDFVRNGLWDTLGERGDVAAILRALRRSFGIAELGTFPQQHLPAALLKTLVGEDDWQAAFSFAFVRNPWDLMVSSYFFFKEHVQEMSGTHHDVDRAEMARRSRTFERFVQYYPAMRSDSVDMLTSEDGASVVDFIGRYEHLERDFSTICERLEIHAKLPHLRRTEHAAYREYYTPATRDAVARHFARDIDRFGYSF